jgi:hypothetical protein
MPEPDPTASASSHEAEAVAATLEPLLDKVKPEIAIDAVHPDAINVFEDGAEDYNEASFVKELEEELDHEMGIRTSSDLQQALTLGRDADEDLGAIRPRICCLTMHSCWPLRSLSHSLSAMCMYISLSIYI